MTTTPESLDLRSASQVDELASAYAERLSCIRRAADDEELARNAQRISRLEAQCRAQRRPRQVVVTTARVDSSLYLG
ncbi:hypothetical protein [Angustibacter sp. Root456]|jgi:hypothetical protein|uniref:hypothetical protein n=1 Tax=Angustibacter sp. Root456 TaxID=1736539 RepID=UPI00070239E0|nr:hypothetical protein [Angustibacter sp. Root456]KQX69669.1 hypothetical protein ASD06_01050 [Angustibacter sp. Root456]